MAGLKITKKITIKNQGGGRVKDLFYTVLIMAILIICCFIVVIPFILKSWHFQTMELAEKNHAEYMQIETEKQKTIADFLRSVKTGRDNR